MCIQARFVNVFAYTVSDAKLHLSKKNNLLLIFTVLNPLLQRIFFTQNKCLTINVSSNLWNISLNSRVTVTGGGSKGRGGEVKRRSPPLKENP